MQFLFLNIFHPPLWLFLSFPLLKPLQHIFQSDPVPSQFSYFTHVFQSKHLIHHEKHRYLVRNSMPYHNIYVSTQKEWLRLGIELHAIEGVKKVTKFLYYRN